MLTLYHWFLYESQLKPCSIISYPLPAAGPDEVPPPACRQPSDSGGRYQNTSKAEHCLSRLSHLLSRAQPANMGRQVLPLLSLHACWPEKPPDASPQDQVPAALSQKPASGPSQRLSQALAGS